MIWSSYVCLHITNNWLRTARHPFPPFQSSLSTLPTSSTVCENISSPVLPSIIPTLVTTPTLTNLCRTLEESSLNSFYSVSSALSPLYNSPPSTYYLSSLTGVSFTKQRLFPPHGPHVHPCMRQLESKNNNTLSTHEDKQAGTFTQPQYTPTHTFIGTYIHVHTHNHNEQAGTHTQSYETLILSRVLYLHYIPHMLVWRDVSPLPVVVIECILASSTVCDCYLGE